MKSPEDTTANQSTMSPVAVRCPSCGHQFTDAEESQVRMALDASEDATETEEPTSMLEAMNQELDDPERQKARAARKE